MQAELRFDIVDNAGKMNQLMAAKRSLVANEETSFTSNMSLSRHLPRDVREKIMDLTHKDKDKNKERNKNFVKDESIKNKLVFSNSFPSYHPYNTPRGCPN